MIRLPFPRKRKFGATPAIVAKSIPAYAGMTCNPLSVNDASDQVFKRAVAPIGPSSGAIPEYRSLPIRDSRQEPVPVRRSVCRSRSGFATDSPNYRRIEEIMSAGAAGGSPNCGRGIAIHAFETFSTDFAGRSHGRRDRGSGVRSRDFAGTAGDDGQAPIWEGIGSVFGPYLGFEKDKDPMIDYRYRGRLVLPPKIALPPPSAAAGSGTSIGPSIRTCRAKRRPSKKQSALQGTSGRYVPPLVTPGSQVTMTATAGQGEGAPPPFPRTPRRAPVRKPSRPITATPPSILIH